MEQKKAAAAVRVRIAAAILSEPAAEAKVGAADETASDRLIVNRLTRCCPGSIGEARRTRCHRMVAVAAVVLSCTAAQAQPRVTFSRVTTDPGLGRFDFVLAVADLNGDGRDDLVVGGRDEYAVGATPEDRFTKTPLHVFVSAGDGRFRPAPELVEGTIEARNAVVVADDFNGDGRDDLAIFDAGAYVDAHSSGYGNPPQLFLSHDDGVFRASTALADAVEREHRRDPPVPPASGPADLHLKTATAGDIDGDGDIDLWVESGGGANVDSHLMVNDGDGTFAVDSSSSRQRLEAEPLPPLNVYGRFHMGHFADLDRDGDSDLVLGHLRHPTRRHQSSLVLVNDGAGYYPTRTELPHPSYTGGVTRVFGIAHFDLNRDGAVDLLILHVGSHDCVNHPGPDCDPSSGRFIQALINAGGGRFVDETPAWIGDQGATAIAGENHGALELHDVDRDGCLDMVVSGIRAPVSATAPLVYLNDGGRRFRAMPPETLTGGDSDFGWFAVPVHADGDQVIDFVVPQHHDGPDTRYGTEDDFTTLVTLLNATPAGSVRCADPANRPPAAAGTLPDRAMAPDHTLTVDVSRVFIDPDGDVLTYRVSSTAPRVVAASATGARVTLTAVGEGTATIRVTATDPRELSASQSFTVTVSTTVSVRFTDDPLQPGVTPVKAVHFTELRTRIDALRSAAGLPRFSWTDPVLRAGVTRVRRVHLIELRAALVEAYRASGRSAPRWSDMSLAAGATPIRAAHLMELRAAVLALE